MIARRIALALALALVPLAAAAQTAPAPPARTSDLPLPDPALTPGDVANHDIKDVCFPGFDEDQGYLRPEYVKETFARYHIPGPLQLHRFVIDRLVPASLGGSSELRNLWAVPLEAERRKRYIEEALQQQVCSGNISLADAQHRMLTDWRAAVTW